MSVIRVNNASTPNNLGAPAVGFNPAIWKGAFLVPAGTQMAASDRASQTALKAWLNGLLHNNNSLLRAQKVGTFEEFTDQGEASQVQTMGLTGRKVKTADGSEAWMFDIIDGGLFNHIALQSYNGQHEYWNLIPYDASGNLFMTQDADDNTKWIGYSLSMLDAQNWKSATRTTVAKYSWSVGFADAYELNQNICVQPCTSFKPWKLKGVQDVYLEVVSSATNVVNVRPLSGGGTLNLATTAGSAWATASNWNVRKATITGNAITTTASLVQPASNDPSQNYIALTLDTGDTDYASGTDAIITLASVSTVNTNTSGWFEDATNRKFGAYAKFTMG